ncbi:MAG: metallophosphoesterase [Candidatus Marinimicrobia bacterium]|nr:metallophosphoesterase [Candidatus Neomarinimicrobiota bacterium]
MSAPRRIVVGDLHGNHRGLSRLLQQVRYRRGQDLLIFAGDYNDHPPGSGGSVRLLIDLLLDLAHEAPDTVHFVRGNHDLWFAEWLQAGGMPDPTWIWSGGDETLASYGIDAGDPDPAAVPELHRRFIMQTPVPYYIDEVLVVVHAGFRTPQQMAAVAAGQLLDPADIYDLTWDRRMLFAEDEATHAQFTGAFGNRYLVAGHSPRGPWVNPRNDKWLLVDSPAKGKGLCAAVISGPDNHEFACIGPAMEAAPPLRRGRAERAI